MYRRVFTRLFRILRRAFGDTLDKIPGGFPPSRM